MQKNRHRKIIEPTSSWCVILELISHFLIEYMCTYICTYIRMGDIFLCTIRIYFIKNEIDDCVNNPTLLHVVSSGGI
jgi:hypothetical protein